MTNGIPCRRTRAYLGDDTGRGSWAQAGKISMLDADELRTPGVNTYSLSPSWVVHARARHWEPCLYSVEEQM